MLFWNLYSRGDKTIWLSTPSQEAVETKITEIDGNIIWVNLPRKDGQVFVLKQNEKVEIGFSFSEGYYCAQTVVAQIGDKHGKVYGLLIPAEFKRQQRRDYVRSKYSTTAMFTSAKSNTIISTEIFDFSAGGLRVFVTPEFENLLQQETSFHVVFQIDSTAFSLPVAMVWLRHRDKILNAGFQFKEIGAKDQDTLMSLALKHSRNK